MRKQLIVIAVLISASVFGQRDSLVLRHGVAFGFNRFPAFYFSPVNSDLNRVYFGYHAGYFLELKNITLRGGVSFNAWGNRESQYSRYNQIGLEIGVEKQLLRLDRTWQLNLGVNFYGGELWNYKPYYQKDRQWLMLGPNVLVGREVGSQWVIITETSIGWGYDMYTVNGKWTAYNNELQLYFWRFLSLGARYSF